MKTQKKELTFTLIAFAFIAFSLIGLCDGIESPQFTVLHKESDFEIRFYRESAWMAASVRGISFNKATKEGFHRLYQYIHGANFNSSRFVMTSPVLASVTPEAYSSDYFVRFYLSPKFQNDPPRPLPELNLQVENWGSYCVAVRKFPGFASDDNINKELESLKTSLGASHSGNATVSKDNNTYTIAQYNASFHPVGRLNEVWVNVFGYVREGCRPDQGI